MIFNFVLFLLPSEALVAKNCLQEHVHLYQHEPIEIITPSYPDNFNGAVSCLYKLQAPEGFRPAVEFLDWEMADCSSDKFVVIDRKVGQHYATFCGRRIPAPITAVGRYLDLNLSLSSRGGSSWGIQHSSARMRIRLSLVRNANYRPPVTAKPNNYDTKPIPTSYRRSKSSDWDLSFSSEEITNIVIGGAFVFVTVLGGLLFSFHLKREEQRKQNRDSLEEKGHPRPTGYRGYLSKVQIKGPAGRSSSGSDEAQTSSTDLGDTTDRSSNADSTPATDTPIVKKSSRERRKRMGERIQNRNIQNRNSSTMERFQRDLKNALKNSGFHSDDSAEIENAPTETPSSIRDNYERNFIPENPKNEQVVDSGRQTRYRDADYEKWTQKRPKRSETMKEKIRRAFSLKSMRETLKREKSRLAGPHARPPMRQRKQNDPQDLEEPPL